MKMQLVCHTSVTVRLALRADTVKLVSCLITCSRVFVVSLAAMDYILYSIHAIVVQVDVSNTLQ